LDEGVREPSTPLLVARAYIFIGKNEDDSPSRPVFRTITPLIRRRSGVTVPYIFSIQTNKKIGPYEVYRSGNTRTDGIIEIVHQWPPANINAKSAVSYSPTVAERIFNRFFPEAFFERRSCEFFAPASLFQFSPLVFYKANS